MYVQIRMRTCDFTGEPDHSRLLMNFPLAAALSRPVNSLKGVSCRRFRQEIPDLKQHYRPEGGAMAAFL